MAYRILADENVERATVTYLRKLGHDVEQVDSVAELGFGAEDEAVARYAREHERLILTQDDDFFVERDVNNTAGLLFQRDQTLSAREVGDIIHEIAQYLDQSEVSLEYVSENWL
jgi:predicted nuclease of predicted toxin-antitoxin system